MSVVVVMSELMDPRLRKVDSPVELSIETSTFMLSLLMGFEMEVMRRPGGI
jgi:hypothetical protein